ncbi:MAG: hypothetical protein FJ037_00965 [Chloroflexi bacterium]|nr:hypothetical protein [Chloroflexota bacterium]
MAEVRIVAKALEDFGDDWHWVVLHDAEPRGERAYWASSVDTICGIAMAEGGIVVTLHDTGAPDQPDCTRCLNEGVSPGLRLALDEVLEVAEALPVAR